MKRSVQSVGTDLFVSDKNLQFIQREAITKYQNLHIHIKTKLAELLYAI